MTHSAGIVGAVVRRADEDRAAGRPHRAEVVDADARRPAARLGAVDRAGRGSGPRRGGGSASRRGPRAPPASNAGATTTSRKMLGQRRGPRRSSTGARERDDAAERGLGIAGERGVPRLEERRALRRAARVRVLDDHARRAAEQPRDGRRRRGVEDVVVRQRLALERRRAGRERPVIGSRAPIGPAVAGRGLVRVLAVAQGLDLLERQRRAPAGTGPPSAAGRAPAGSVDAGLVHPARQLGGDPRVVRGGVAERLDRERRPEAERDAAGLVQGREDRLVARRASSRSPRRRDSSRPRGPATGRRCRSPRRARRA